MAALGKRTPVVLFVLLLLGTAVHLAVKQRLERRLASAAAERQRQLTELRTENRRLLNLAQSTAAPAATVTLPEVPTAVRQMKAATALLQTGLFGPFAWTRGQNNSIADEVSALADALGLSAGQKAAMRSAADQCQNAVVAAVLASVKVQLNENSVRGAAETPEEVAERHRLMENASPLEKMAISARSLSKQAASRGEREVSIEIPATPAARAAFDAMQAQFAEIMGPDVYAFYQSAGASTTIEGMFNELGLQPHWLSLISRPAGSLSAADEMMNAARARAREAAIAAGRPPPPERPVPTTPGDAQGTVYEFHRIRSMATLPDIVTRSPNRPGGGGGGGGPLSGIIDTGGVSLGSSQAITADALRKAMGPLQSLIPIGF